ncbi:MAG: chloride channel protein [Armatimonadota bacterium]
MVLSGIFFGACSFLLVETMECGRAVASKLGVPAAVKALVGGSALVLLAAVISPRYLGLGLDTIESALGGTPTPWYAPFAKMVFTSITLNFGGSGGIVTPVFFVGATAGNLLSHMLNLDGPTSAALGMVGLLAGATNTPIAASIMAVEMFGSAIAPYAAVACVISFIITGHRSVYPSQVLAFKKSQLLDVETGSQIAQVQVKPRVVRSSLLGRVILNVHRLYDRRSGTPDQR